jgi:hypothetical protein
VVLLAFDALMRLNSSVFLFSSPSVYFLAAAVAALSFFSILAFSLPRSSMILVYLSWVLVDKEVVLSVVASAICTVNSSTYA